MFQLRIFSVRRECHNHYISVCGKFSTELKCKIIKTEMGKKFGSGERGLFRGYTYADIYLDKH
jgi:hypothetical protein